MVILGRRGLFWCLRGRGVEKAHKRRVYGLDSRADDHLELSALLDYAKDSLRCLELIGICPTCILKSEPQPAGTVGHALYIAWATNEVEDALRERLFVHLCLRV